MPRNPNDRFQVEFVLTYEHPQVTADTTRKLFKVPVGKALRIDGVEYVNDTGLAADATNYFAIKIVKGASTVVASWSTLTGAQGTIAADTFVSLDNSPTDEDLVFSETEILSMFLDETGAATLPIGRLVIRGRWVK